MRNHDYGSGNFAPVTDERTVTDLEVTGTIPEHLNGRYLRNGPNPISEIDPETYNWFTGDGMIHGVRLRDGRAEWYRNRWVRSQSVARALGERPPPSNPKAGFDAAAGNTNVIGHAGRILALVEAGAASYELTEDLDTLRPCDFDGTLPGGFTAHPKRDPDTGELHAVSYFFGRGNTVQYSVIDQQGRARRTVDVEVGGSPMMHDFCLTEHHVIFFDLPVTFDTRQAVELTVPSRLRRPAQLVMSALVGRIRVPDPISARAGRTLRSNSRLPYSWNPHYPARVGVMPRDGDSRDVRWFEVEQCYVFHPLNAYDDGSSVVVDLVRHPKIFDTNRNGPDEGDPTLERWVVDLDAENVRRRRLDDRPQEFPRMDPRLLGKHHRFGYTPMVGAGPGRSSALVKHDLRYGTSSTHDFGTDISCGEFVFEPDSSDSAEDDGVLMGFVYDKRENRSDLVLLDASSLEKVAAIHLPRRVPNGFHGNWIPSTTGA